MQLYLTIPFILKTTLYLSLILNTTVGELSFYQDVAAKCNGEAAWALEPCVATVRNRLDNGWNRDNVLSQYYANDYPYTQEDLKTVKEIFSSNKYPLVYYMLGSPIDDHYRPHDKPPLEIDGKTRLCHPENNNLCVLFFSRY